MTPEQLEAFKAEAVRKNAAYERNRRVVMGKILAFYSDLHGEGFVK